MPFPGVKETVEIFLKWVDDHLSIRYFSMFFILSSVFLFTIDRILSLLGLPSVPSAYLVIAAIIAVTMGAGTIFCLVEKGVKRLQEQRRKHIKARIYRDLPKDELDILSMFAVNGTKTEVIYENEQPLFSLVSKDILQQAGEYYVGSGMCVDRNVYTLTSETNNWIRSPEGRNALREQDAKLQ